MSREKHLAELYRSFVRNTTDDDNTLSEFVKLLSLTFQNVLFKAARDEGYNMNDLKHELESVMKEEFADDLKQEEGTVDRSEEPSKEGQGHSSSN